MKMFFFRKYDNSARAIRADYIVGFRAPTRDELRHFPDAQGLVITKYEQNAVNYITTIDVLTLCKRYNSLERNEH